MDITHSIQCSCFREHTISGKIYWVLRFKTIIYSASSWKLSSNVFTVKPWTPLVWEQRGKLIESTWFWARLVLQKFQVFFNELTFSELSLSTLFWSGGKPKKRFLWGMGNIFRLKEERGSFIAIFVDENVGDNIQRTLLRVAAPIQVIHDWVNLLLM